jgi:hypothetical protein
MTPILPDVAVLMSTANLATSSVCGESLRALLIATYLSGWRDCSTRAPRQTEEQSAREAANRVIPRFTTRLVTRALDSVYQQQRSELVSIFREYPYVGLSIDGATIKSRKFLNVDIVNPVSNTLPSTYDFLENTSFTATQFGDLLASV